MKIFKSKYKTDDYVNKVIAKSDFRNFQTYIRELYNILYPLGDTDRIRNYMFNHVLCLEKEDIDKNSEYLEGLIRNFDSSKFKLSSERIFKKVLQKIPKEKLYYYQSNRKKVIYKELLFVLIAICSAVLKKNKRESILAYNYFLCQKASEDFQKNTGRSINSNKLAHIISVLKKYNLVSVDFTKSKGTSIYRIGSENPLYMFDDIPNVEVTEEKTSAENQLERTLGEVEQLNKLLETQENIIITANQKIELLEDTLARQVPQKWNIANKPVKKTDTFESDLADLISWKNKKSVSETEVLSGEEYLHNVLESFQSMAG